MIVVRRHPAQLMEPAGSTALGLIVVFTLDTMITTPATLLRNLLWIGWLVLLSRFLWRFANWYVDYFIVTDRRLMLTTGVLARKVGMMPLSRVTDMRYDKPVIGRLLGYGVFFMESAGQDQALSKVDFVPNPDVLYLEISDLLFGEKEEDDTD